MECSVLSTHMHIIIVFIIKCEFTFCMRKENWIAIFRLNYICDIVGAFAMENSNKTTQKFICASANSQAS